MNLFVRIALAVVVVWLGRSTALGDFSASGGGFLTIDPAAVLAYVNELTGDSAPAGSQSSGSGTHAGGTISSSGSVNVSAGTFGSAGALSVWAGHTYTGPTTFSGGTLNLPGHMLTKIGANQFTLHPTSGLVVQSGNLVLGAGNTFGSLSGTATNVTSGGLRFNITNPTGGAYIVTDGSSVLPLTDSNLSTLLSASYGSNALTITRAPNVIVPEPASAALAGCGLLVLAACGICRRRRIARHCGDRLNSVA